MKNIEEKTEINEVLDAQQRIARRQLFKRLKSKIQRGRQLAKRRMASKDKLDARAEREARQLMRIKVAGKQGQDYKNLPLASRIQIDKRLAAKKSAIKKLSKRLLPKIRKAEQERLARVRATSSASNQQKNEEYEYNCIRELYDVINFLINNIDEEDALDMAREKIEKEKESDDRKHEIMIDRAKTVNKNMKNKEEVK